MGALLRTFITVTWECNHLGICDCSNCQLQVILNITQYSFCLRS
jgi:hypothetical protein